MRGRALGPGALRARWGAAAGVASLVLHAVHLGALPFLAGVLGVVGISHLAAHRLAWALTAVTAVWLVAAAYAFARRRVVVIRVR